LKVKPTSEKSRLGLNGKTVTSSLSLANTNIINIDEKSERLTCIAKDNKSGEWSNKKC